MLRLDVDGGAPYAIPADNPFVGHPTARPEIWAYGLRNPWRYSFDRVTGDLYIADVGERIHEEVDFQPASSLGGENYGWSIMEGIACYNPPSGCATAGLTLPVHEYTHADAGGCAISGGYVYRGSAVPAMVGRYFYADFCHTWVRSIMVSGGIAFGLRDHTNDFGYIPGIVSFGEDGQGELYIVSLNGRVHRLADPSP
jgi:glucose/arabinose dehydrogenase